MVKLQKIQQGFAVVEALLVVVIVLLIGVAGWYVYGNHSSKADGNTKTSTAKTPANSAANSSTPRPDSQITSGPGADWNTYTNDKIGFSIQIPKLYLSSDGAPCTQVTYVYDNYGNKVPSAAHYIPTRGAVPATVIADGSKFYIVEQYTYQPSDTTADNTGHELAASCPKTDTTVDVINNYNQHDLQSFELNPLPFSVINAYSQQDVLNWAKSYFKDNTIAVAATSENAGGWEDIILDCTSANPCRDFNFKFYLRYYKAQNKLVYMEQGQSGHLQTPDGKSFYDQQVWDSFRLK